MIRICVFCGARPGRDEAYLHVARDAARAIAARGYGIVYGGGRVGMMGALADAALAAGAEVIGVIPEALAAAEIAHSGVTQLHVVESMHARKAMLAQLSDAFIALPGGIGTMDEFFEALTWRQLRIHDKPIGLLNSDGYYDPLVTLLDTMLAHGLLPPATRAFVTTRPSIDEILDAFAL